MTSADGIRDSSARAGAASPIDRWWQCGCSSTFDGPGRSGSAFFGLAEEAGFDNGRGGLVGDGPEDFELLIVELKIGVVGGHAHHPNGLGPGIQRHAHPGRRLIIALL